MSQDVENMSFYVFVGAPPGPDPRRAPPGPRGGPRRARSPQGPTRAQVRAQGPGESPGEGPGEGSGPDARVKRALDSSIYMKYIDPRPTMYHRGGFTLWYIYIYIYICICICTCACTGRVVRWRGSGRGFGAPRASRAGPCTRPRSHPRSS